MSGQDARRHALYRDVGEAMHLAQTLELNVSILLSILDRRFESPPDSQGLVLCEDKKTVGRLLNLLRERTDISANGLDLLKRALQKRNDITHHFFNKNVYAFSDEDAFKTVSERLKADTRVLAEATVVIEGFVKATAEAYGLKVGDILVRQDGQGG